MVCLTRNEALRVAFIHVEESGVTEGKISKEYFSKLVKADIHGKDQVDINKYIVCIYELTIDITLKCLLNSFHMPSLCSEKEKDQWSS